MFYLAYDKFRIFSFVVNMYSLVTLILKISGFLDFLKS